MNAPTDSTAPTSPSGVSASAGGSAQIALSWSPAADNVGVQGYRVYRNGVYLSAVGPVGSTSFTDTGLTPSTAYVYTVAAVDAAGNISPQSSSAGATTTGPDSGAPSVPVGLNATTTAWNSVGLAWSASTDNVGVVAYTIFRGGTKLSTVNGTVLNFADRGTAGSTAYSYTVTARDAAGNESAPSSAAPVTTPAEPDVFVLSPWPSATLFAIEQVNVDVEGVDPVDRVELLVDAQLMATDQTAPYDINWDTSAVEDGPHVIVARKVVTGGAMSSSDPLLVNVQNSLNPSERVAVDYASGRIDRDTFALNGVFAVGAPTVLPERYQATSSSGGPDGIELFVADWDLLSPSTQDTINDFLGQPLRGNSYAASLATGGPYVPQPPPPPGIDDACEHVIYDYHLSFDFEGSTYICVHESPHFAIKYRLEGTGIFAADSVSSDNSDFQGAPDYIDEITAGLEDAYDVYTGPLAWPTSWPGRVPVELRAMDGGQVLPQGLSAGSPLDPVQTIEMDVDTTSPRFLGHHELFHVFQYQYVGFDTLGTLVTDEPGLRWWTEATAQWAAGFVSRSGKPSDSAAYAGVLPIFLGRPTDKINQFDGGNQGRQYGSFVVPEYLVEFLDKDAGGNPVFNPSIVRETWEKLRTDPQDPLDAVQIVAADHGETLASRLPDFWHRNYLLEYDDSVLPNSSDIETAWRPALAGDVRTASEGDGIAPARPARVRRDVADGVPVGGQWKIEHGGAVFVELVPQDGAAGDLSVVTDGADSQHVNARIMTLTYPAGQPANAVVCDDIPLSTVGVSGQASVRLEGDCRYAVLVLSQVDLPGKSTSVISWFATFTIRPALDNFERVVAGPGWGTASSGDPWTSFHGGGGTSSVDGHAGVSTLPAGAFATHELAMANWGQLHRFQMTARFRVNTAVPNTGAMSMVFSMSASNPMRIGRFNVQVGNSSVGGLYITRVDSTLEKFVKTDWVSNQDYLLRYEFDAAAHAHRLKVWLASEPEPDWQLTQTPQPPSSELPYFATGWTNSSGSSSTASIDAISIAPIP